MCNMLYDRLAFLLGHHVDENPTGVDICWLSLNKRGGKGEHSTEGVFTRIRQFHPLVLAFSLTNLHLTFLTPIA